MALRSAAGCRGLLDPLPARRLAAHLGYQVTRPDLLGGITPEAANWLCSPDCGWSACVLTGSGVRLVLYNPSESLSRQESSLMHELAHLLCGHPSTALDFGCGLALRSFDEDCEEEAAWLGACLQLPERVLVAATKRRMSIEEIATHFTASVPMVRYRYHITGLARRFGRNGRG